jgi:heterodisulfide reductase subunit C
MIDFGYTLTPSSRIDLDKIDKTNLKALFEAEPDMYKCIACGSCAASCSAGNFSQANLRKVLLLLERGMEDQALSLIEGCMLCGKCTLVCPRGINTRNIIRNILKVYKEN